MKTTVNVEFYHGYGNVKFNVGQGPTASSLKRLVSFIDFDRTT